MYLRLCKSNREFREEYHKLLDKEEAKLGLFYTNCQDDLFTLDNNHIRGGVYNDKNQLQLLFLDANPFALQLYGIKNSLEVSECLVNYLKEKEINITGFLGNTFDTNIFCNAYQRVFTNQVKRRLSMDILEVRKVKKIEEKGSLVLASADDFDFLLKGYLNFSMDCFHELGDVVTYTKAIQNGLNNHNHYIFMNKENKKVGFIKIITRGKHGKTLSSVYIYDEYRGKGYAKTMVNLMCKEALKEVQYVNLFVDQANPISNKVYFDNGFRKVVDMIEYKIKYEK